MLALQLDFENRQMVVFNNLVLGELLLDKDDAFAIFSIIQTEYKEVYRLIRQGLRSETMSYFVRDAIVGGELHVTVSRADCGIFDVIDRSIFPLKRDRLSVNYVKCSKTYVLKPSISFLRKDLQLCEVIK